MSRKVLAVVCGLVSVAALAAAAWLALGSIGGPVPMSQQEESLAVGGGNFSICVQRGAKCPLPCAPPTCTATPDRLCIKSGGRAGCGTLDMSFVQVGFCEFSPNPFDYCSENPNLCGQPLAPFCPPFDYVTMSCPAGGCATGGGTACNGC
jgi:hypothetical protein